MSAQPDNSAAFMLGIKTTETVVFTDLDDTLIFTAAKIPAGANHRASAMDRRGNTLSYLCTPHRELISIFKNHGARIIPVTGRNLDALNRIDFVHLFNSYKIVSHGAVVIAQEGGICPEWAQALKSQFEDWPEYLQETNSEVKRTIQKFQLEARCRVIIDQGVSAYVSIKGEAQALATIKAEHRCRPGMLRHENGRDHALLPPYASKALAVSHVKQQLGLDINDLTIGIGDSLTDIPFLRECHFSMTPRGSQIHEAHEW